ncbi:MAG: hypothetical protein ACE15B_12875 [Bryobacteraceae bacterium]
MADENQPTLPVNPPLGMYPARVDEKGRIKLPVVFQEHLKRFSEPLFATSLDRRTGRIYPKSIWLENLKFFERYKENPKAARNLIFVAQDLGSETAMDSQGRVQLSPELRRELGIENQAVKVYADRGRIEILSEAVYEQRKRQAAETSESDLDAAERAGLL